MERQKFEKQKDWMVRSAAALVIVSALTALAECVAAIPAAVVYYEDKHRYTATADVEASATNVYAAADQVTEPTQALISPKKMTRTLLLEAKKGSQFVSIKAAELPSSKTRLVVIADKDVKAADQTLPHRDAVCDRLGVTYTLVKS